MMSDPTDPIDTDVPSEAVRLAAADADEFRAEGPRIDGRIGTLLSLLLGSLASAGAIGGAGASISRARHAHIATWLLIAAAVVIAVGAWLIVRLILPRLPRVPGPDDTLALVAALPDARTAREHYLVAAVDPLGYQAMRAHRHAVAIRRRYFRFRRAGRVLMGGVALATLGFLALSLGW